MYMLVNTDVREKITLNGTPSYSPHSTLNGTATTAVSSSPPPALTSMNTNLFYHTHSSNSTTHDSAVSTTIVTTAGVTGGTTVTTTTNGRDNHRQLLKVRRFLTTLQQFASDIGHDVGEKVRGLIINLLSASITVEEFHSALQEVTHFPLRPFVLPFLKSHLPPLTREIHSHARRAAVPLTQYIAMQEQNLLDGATVDLDFFSTDLSSTATKRKHADSYFENGENNASSITQTAASTSTNGPLIGGGTQGLSPPPSKRANLLSPPYPNMGISPDFLCGGNSREFRAAPDDEWKNIHVMLACILSMVEKTRRALTMLQQREEKDLSFQHKGYPTTATFDGTRNRNDYDSEVKRHATELVAQAIRSTEERVAEIKRKAEEAVSEVKRAAVNEVQRAVSAAESKAQEMVAADRNRIESLLREIAKRESTAGEQKVDPQQACWNCGRKAQDTCSGCSVAKYCGPFCQHKDWDHHHKVCSPSLAISTSTTSASKTNCKVIKSPDISKAE